MDTLECISTRRSVRKFLDIPVEFEKVGNILDAGRYAPSAGNLQDWKFILVTDADMREELSKGCVEEIRTAAEQESDCSSAKIEESLFIPPESIEFSDMTELIRELEQLSAQLQK